MVYVGKSEILCFFVVVVRMWNKGGLAVEGTLYGGWCVEGTFCVLIVCFVLFEGLCVENVLVEKEGTSC